jgi:hypothetical protein
LAIDLDVGDEQNLLIILRMSSARAHQPVMLMMGFLAADRLMRAARRPPRSLRCSEHAHGSGSVYFVHLVVGVAVRLELDVVP